MKNIELKKSVLPFPAGLMNQFIHSQIITHIIFDFSFVITIGNFSLFFGQLDKITFLKDTNSSIGVSRVLLVTFSVVITAGCFSPPFPFAEHEELNMMKKKKK